MNPSLELLIVVDGPMRETVDVEVLNKRRREGKINQTQCVSSSHLFPKSVLFFERGQTKPGIRSWRRHRKASL